MFRQIKKTYFTLIEVLLVLFLLSLCVAVTGVKLKDAYTEQRFLSESQQVLSHLRMAQDLMLILDTDVQVKFTTNDKHELICQLEVEKPLEKKETKESWKRLIEGPLVLKAIRSLNFQGRYYKNLTVYFTLGKMSQGLLTFYDTDSPGNTSRTFALSLNGYPSAIEKSMEGSLPDRRSTVSSELLYPVEVYEKETKKIL